MRALTAGLILLATAVAAQEVKPADPAATTPPAPAAALAPQQPAPAPPAAAAAQAAGPVDIAKAVDCATLSQQFTDTLTVLTGPTATTKLDEQVQKAGTDTATAGRKACMQHDYDAGLEQLRQAVSQLGKKPIL